MKKYAKWIMLVIAALVLAGVIYYAWPIIDVVLYFIRGGGIH